MAENQATFDIITNTPEVGPFGVPFTKIAHCPHQKASLISILRTLDTNGPGICFTGKPHHDFPNLGPLSWWGIIPDKAAMPGHPVADFNTERSDTFKLTNRYGPIRFSIPLSDVLGDFYCGGTRGPPNYHKQEYSHTTIVSKNDVPAQYPRSTFLHDPNALPNENTSLYCNIPKDLSDNYGNHSFLWWCYRWAGNADTYDSRFKWDHPEFAIVVNNNGFNLTAVDGLRINFVPHQGAICVKRSSPYNEICDMNWTAKTARDNFIRIIHENDMTFENFKPFFEDTDWDRLVDINNEFQEQHRNVNGTTTKPDVNPIDTVTEGVANIKTQ